MAQIACCFLGHAVEHTVTTDGTPNIRQFYPKRVLRNLPNPQAFRSPKVTVDELAQSCKYVRSHSLFVCWQTQKIDDLHRGVHDLHEDRGRGNGHRQIAKEGIIKDGA